MYKCEKLSKKNFNSFLELNNKAKDFNELNLDYNHIYESLSFKDLLMLKNNIKLLKVNEEYHGFVWYNTDDSRRNIIIIDSLYLEPTDINVDLFNCFINKLKKNLILEYETLTTERNSKELRAFGFKEYKGNIEMELCLKDFNKYNYLLNKNVTFQTFIQGKHELIRCEIQNQVFKNKDRIPLTVDDIYFDETQEYYLEDCSIFLKYNEEYIGYGQIILDNKPIIVNLGILENYRGLGLGKVLLLKLIEMAKKRGFNHISIKVLNSNIIAKNLYKSLGFREQREFTIWQLSVKKKR